MAKSIIVGSIVLLSGAVAVLAGASILAFCAISTKVLRENDFK